MADREMGKYELIKTKVEVCKRGLLEKKGDAGESQSTVTPSEPASGRQARRAIRTKLSDDAKAGLRAVPSSLSVSVGRDFLSEQSPLPPEEPGNRVLGRRRLSVDRGALARDDGRPLAGVHGFCSDPRKTSRRDDP